MENINITSKTKLTAKDIKRKPLDFVKNNKNIMIAVIIMFTVVVTLLVANKIGEKTSVETGADLTQAHLYMSPENQTMPPDSVFSVMLDAGESQLGFGRIEIEYDKDKIGLYRDIEVSEAFRIIEATPIDIANDTGKITLVVGVDPIGVDPQTGIIELAKLWFTTTTTLSNQTAYIDFVNPELQIVGLSPLASFVTTTGATLALNPASQATPTPTSTPVGQSCDNICQENGFSSGICTRNKGQCKKVGGSYLGSGDSYCQTANTACCCN